MTTQLSIFDAAQPFDNIEELPAADPIIGRDTGTYPCPCCDTVVYDTYVEGDALCCWCRNIDDPRLSDRVREVRQRAPGLRRCCLARSRGKSRTLVGWACTQHDSRVTPGELAPAMREGDR